MTNTLIDIEPIEQLALHKIELNKATRKKIDPGSYPVDLVVHITGTIGVGEDYEQTISPAVPWRGLFLAVVSQMAPVLREAIVRDYLEKSDRGPATVNEDALADDVTALADAIMGTSKRTCNGKTRASLNVVVLEKVGEVA